MKLSPGLQLVWNLAARETLAAAMAEIEPEHFLCAILKYVELTNADLESVAAQPVAATLLVAERDQLRVVAVGRSIDSTRVRRRLRQELGRGASPPTGEVIHRSDASRRLFENAAKLALRDLGVIETPHLLRVLMDAPTPAMVKVLGKGKVGEARVDKSRVRSVLLERHTRDLGELEVPPPPEVAGPQGVVLSEALQADRSDWVLLICEPQVNPHSLAALAQSAGEETPRILVFNPAGMKVDPDHGSEFATSLTDLLAELSYTDRSWMLIDTSGDDKDLLKLVLIALRTLPPDIKALLILAVTVDAFRGEVERDPSLDRLFRPIWLHRLTAGPVPAEF